MAKDRIKWHEIEFRSIVVINQPRPIADADGPVLGPASLQRGLAALSASIKNENCAPSGLISMWVISGM